MPATTPTSTAITTTTDYCYDCHLFDDHYYDYNDDYEYYGRYCCDFEYDCYAYYYDGGYDFYYGLL